MKRPGLVIVGGSYAGIGIAEAARRQGYGEPIRLVCDEDRSGYHRPPLSKGFITTPETQTALPLRAEAFYRDNSIELMLATRIVAIDRAKRQLATTGGETLDFDTLAIASGARPRVPSLPGIELAGVVALRSLHDALRIRGLLGGIENVVVIGAGFIGLELAATFAKAGKSVVVLELQNRILARALGPLLSAFLAQAHAANGVDIHLETSVEAIVGSTSATGGSRVSGVRTRGGRLFPADLVIVAIGAVPNTELAQAAGLACADGIVVDASCRTDDGGIVAAGDCTRHPNAFADGAPVRLESVQNANDQAKVAGATVAGQAATYAAVPWFWSDQYALKLQIVGLMQAGDQAVLRGNPDDGRFSVFYFRGERLTAVESINRPADHMAGRALIGGHIPLGRKEAADTSFDFKSLLRGGVEAAG